MHYKWHKVLVNYALICNYNRYLLKHSYRPGVVVRPRESIQISKTEACFLDFRIHRLVESNHIHLSDLMSHPLTFTHSTLETLSSFLFLKHKNPLFPQGLCTCSFLCPDFSPLMCSVESTLPSDVCSHISLSLRSPLSIPYRVAILFHSGHSVSPQFWTPFLPNHLYLIFICLFVSPYAQ